MLAIARSTEAMAKEFLNWRASDAGLLGCAFWAMHCPRISQQSQQGPACQRHWQAVASRASELRIGGQGMASC